MAMRTGRARYPARVTPQMSAELKARLLKVAEREHGGGLQALRRQCLQARVEGNRAGPDQLPEVLQAEVLQVLDRLRQEAAERNQEPWVRRDTLLDGIGQMNRTLNLHLMEMTATRDKVQKLGEEAAKQNRERRLE